MRLSPPTLAVAAVTTLLGLTPATGVASPPTSPPGQSGAVASAERLGPASQGLAPQSHPTLTTSVLGASIADNGGFEQASGDGAAGWLVHDLWNRTVCTPSGSSCANPYQTFYGAPSTAPEISIDRTVARSGVASAKLVAHGGGPAQYETPISPTGPRTYTLTFWARATGGGQAHVDARTAFVKDFFAADIWTFPADGQWHQMLGSTTIPLSQHDVTLALRSSTSSSPVWIDDVALRPLPFTITAGDLGTQVVGANAATFTVTAYQNVPAGLALSTVVTRPDGTQRTVNVPLPPVPGGHSATVRVPYDTATPGRYSLDPSVVTGDGQTVWHDVRALQNQNNPYVGDAVPTGYPNLVFTLDQPLTTTLVSPRYHRALFPGDGVGSVQVRGQLTLPADAATGEYRWQASLVDGAGKVLASTPQAPAASRAFTASFPTGGLPTPARAAGADFASADYHVTVTVTGPGGFHATSTEAFRKLGDSPSGVTATVDDNDVVRVNGQPFFPRGMYRAEDLPSLKYGQFNVSLWDRTFPHHVPTPGSDTYNQEMAAGVRYVVDVSPISASVNPFTGGPLTLPDGTSTTARACQGNYQESPTCMDAYLQAMIGLFRNDPQVIGYAFEDEYLYDRYIAHAYQYVVDHDPYRFMYETVHYPFDDANIVNAADVLAADPYPIKPTVNESVLEVSTQLDTLKAVARGRDAVWLVPAAFAGEPGWNPPTTGELRAMVYLGMLHGASGNYAYATYSGEVYPMPADCARWSGDPGIWGSGDAYLLHWYVWCTPLWPAYAQLGREAATLQPILAYGQDVTADWSRATATGTSSVDYTVRRQDGHTWLVLANTSDQAATATFTASGDERGAVTNAQVAELFTGDAGATAGGPLAVAPGSLTVTLSGYQTRAFRIG